MEYEKIVVSLADAISDAFSVFTELGEEMREAFDNTPENLQQSAKGQMREEAADALESISEVSCPVELAQAPITLQIRKLTSSQLRKRTRPQRRDAAIDKLDACISALQDIADDEARAQNVRDEASSLVDDLENAKGDAEAVEFPGMY